MKKDSCCERDSVLGGSVPSSCCSKDGGQARVPESLELKGQVALVTGGSRGIGRAVALELAKKGAHVYINYSQNKDAALEVAALCNDLNRETHQKVDANLDGGATLVGFDVSNSQLVGEAFDLIKDKSGRLDILVNNAGISHDGLFIRMKDEDFVKTLETNLNGAFYCARGAAKLMVKARYGRIINISSVVALMGNPGQVPYVSSKAGLIGLTKAVAKELASRNITANAVTPGFIETDMTQSLGEELREEFIKTIPLGRYGSAEEVASLVGFLASPRAAYITGQVIGINGGMYM